MDVNWGDVQQFSTDILRLLMFGGRWDVQQQVLFNKIFSALSCQQCEHGVSLLNTISSYNE